MKKKFLLFAGVAVLLLGGLFSPSIAHAQLMETDKDITTTFHIDPNDHPLPGKPATLYFQIYDITKKFSLSNCTCTVTITEQGKQVFTQALTQNQKEGSDWDASVPYTFQQKDNYQVALTGEPVVADAFQPFKSAWTIAVEPGVLVTNDPDHTPLYFMIGIPGITIAAVLLCFLATRF